MEQKPRIWYPDFYLPEFGTYIEYYGLAGQQNYDQGLKAKQSAYSKMGFEVISVFPWMIKQNWQKYIMKELERNTVRRYKNLTAKPYWSHHRSAICRNVYPAPNGYRGAFKRLY